MHFGLRSRAAARGLFQPSAAATGPKPGADSGKPEDKAAKPGASEDENAELDENSNPVKPEDAKGSDKPEDKPGATEDETGKATTSEEDKAKAGLTGNARVKAILQAPGASAQRPLAEYLALDTEIDAATASTILGKVTATAAPAAAKAGGKPAFLAAMENVANPTTAAASGAAAVEPGKEGTVALADMMATLRDHGFVK